jgi:hypothetical protein
MLDPTIALELSPAIREENPSLGVARFACDSAASESQSNEGKVKGDGWQCPSYMGLPQGLKPGFSCRF